MPKKIFLFIALSTSGIIYTSETTHKELPHKACAHIVHTTRYGVNLMAHIFLNSPQFSMHTVTTDCKTETTYKQNGKKISSKNISEQTRKELSSLHELLMAKAKKGECFENRYSTWFIDANNEIIQGNETLINN